MQQGPGTNRLARQKRIQPERSEGQQGRPDGLEHLGGHHAGLHVIQQQSLASYHEYGLGDSCWDIVIILNTLT